MRVPSLVALSLATSLAVGCGDDLPDGTDSAAATDSATGDTSTATDSATSDTSTATDSATSDTSTATDSATGSDAAPDAPTIGETQSWSGTFSGAALPSGSNAIRVVFRHVGDWGMEGEVFFGDGAPLAPATDPTGEYPPGVTSRAAGWPNRVIHEGHPYSIRMGYDVPGRLFRFTVNTMELFESWCALQTPPADGYDRCLGRVNALYRGADCFTVDPSTAEESPVTCAQLNLCVVGEACECDPSGCRADLGAGHRLELNVDGDTADGTLDGLILPDRTVALTRDP